MALALRLLACVLARASAKTTLGAVQSFACDRSACNLTCATVGDGETAAAAATAPLRLEFWSPSIVRWWLAVDGNFSDVGAAATVLRGARARARGANLSAARDDGDGFVVRSARAEARVAKADCTLSLRALDAGARDGDAGRLALAEAAPLAWDEERSWQTLAIDAAAPMPAARGGLSREHFFGGGMQNGRFAHRGATIGIGVDYDWDDGGHPNAVPWCASRVSSLERGPLSLFFLFASTSPRAGPLLIASFCREPEPSPPGTSRARASARSATRGRRATIRSATRPRPRPAARTSS